MKTTITEKFHTNCPNCGGVIGECDKFCTFCGTRIVYERTVTQEDGGSQDVFEAARKEAEKQHGKNETEPATIVPFIIGIAFMMVWSVTSFSMAAEIEGAFGDGNAAIMPKAFGWFGIFMIGVFIYLIIKAKKKKD